MQSMPRQPKSAASPSPTGPPPTISTGTSRIASHSLPCRRASLAAAGALFPPRNGLAWLGRIPREERRRCLPACLPMARTAITALAPDPPPGRDRTRRHVMERGVGKGDSASSRRHPPNSHATTLTTLPGRPASSSARMATASFTASIRARPGSRAMTGWRSRTSIRSRRSRARTAPSSMPERSRASVREPRPWPELVRAAGAAPGAGHRASDLPGAAASRTPR